MADNLKENFRQFRIEHDNRIAESYLAKTDALNYATKDEIPPFVDTDAFATKTEVTALSNKQQELEQAKLGGEQYPLATDSDINQMLNFIFEEG